MKKIINVSVIIFLIFNNISCNGNKLFKILSNGNVVSPDGTEYVFFAGEGKVNTFGERNFLGKIQFENPKLYHLGGSRETGMFSCDESIFDILYRIRPDSEWGSFYRKANLPIIDLKIENCKRLEFIHYKNIKFYENNISPEKLHLTCNEGIINNDEIELFLTSLKKEKSPDEADLYEKIRKENGLLENCYLLGYIYGYFDNDINLAIPYQIWSFNDLAYSIDTDFGKFVLPLEWLIKLGYRKE